MENMNNLKEIMFNSFNKIGMEFADSIGNIIGAIIVLLVGWLVTKLVLFAIKRLLILAKTDKITELVNEKEIFGKTGITFNTNNIILGFVKWILYLGFLVAAADVLNWTIISQEISNLMRYLPKLFSAIALFMIGLYIASFIKNAVKGLFDSFDLSGSNVISSIVFYLIVIIFTLTAVNQAGVDTQIITTNLSIILAAILFTLAIAFGLGSKDVVGDLLRTFNSRKKFEIGQCIIVKDIKGEIISFDSDSLTVKTKKGRVIIPIKEIVENNVEVID